VARILVVVALTAGLALLPADVRASSDRADVVLGAKNLFSPDGRGWGTAHPRLIDNGGDPNGRAWNLRWVGWGSAFALGRGMTWIFRPSGGYFTKPGLIELRAYRVGHCSSNTARAYTRLRARESLRPRGPFGRWFTWAGLRTICRRSYLP
jgi:hypothetical protein